MLRFAAAVLLTTFVAATTIAAQAAAPAAPSALSQTPQVILDAMNVVRGLKAGDTRAEVERNFVLDGGLNSNRESTYLFKGCCCIKIRVDFSLSPGSTSYFSTADTVIRVSKPYLECPFYD
jgi:hypothetical protein